MTAAAEGYTRPLRQTCGGPCRDWKGHVWGFTCAACISQEMDVRAARAADKDQKNRERLVRSLKIHSSGRTTPKGGGSDSYVPHRPSALAPNP